MSSPTSRSPSRRRPVHFAAELYAGHGREDKALELLETALELAETEDDSCRALRLKLKVLSALEDDNELRHGFGFLPRTETIPQFVDHVRAGTMRLSAGDFKAAESHFQRALEIDACSADALHGLGLVRHARGDFEGTVQAWLATRELDLKASRPK